jgi:hypothetical protein
MGCAFSNMVLKIDCYCCVSYSALSEVLRVSCDSLPRDAESHRSKEPLGVHRVSALLLTFVQVFVEGR